MIMNLADGSTRQTDTPTDKMRAELSPDGTRVLFVQSTESEGKVQGRLRLIDVDGTNESNLSERIY